MKKKKISTANLVVCVVVLVAFLLILLGAALFERGMNEETVPAETGTGEAVQTTVSASEAPAETMTEAMIETTMPAREPKNINFLFVGRDWHDEGENGRSDTMILCNVYTIIIYAVRISRNLSLIKIFICIRHNEHFLFSVHSCPRKSGTL